jgi:hypothetical protein
LRAISICGSSAPSSTLAMINSSRSSYGTVYKKSLFYKDNKSIMLACSGKVDALQRNRELACPLNTVLLWSLWQRRSEVAPIRVPKIRLGVSTGTVQKVKILYTKHRHHHLTTFTFHFLEFLPFFVATSPPLIVFVCVC